MPIHLIWGDDYEACNREIEEIIQTVIDPSWKSFNYSQIDGNDQKQNFRALEEVQSAPLGSGGRVVLVRRSPFCNGCSAELANKLEKTINLSLAVRLNKFWLNYRARIMFSKVFPAARKITTSIMIFKII